MSNPATMNDPKISDRDVFEGIIKLGMSNGMTIEHALLKEKVLAILTTPVQNADLSWEVVDKRFIEKIEKL